MNAVFTNEQYTINVSAQSQAYPPPQRCGRWFLGYTRLARVPHRSAHRVSFIITPFRNAASFFGGSLSSLFSHSRMSA